MTPRFFRSRLPVSGAVLGLMAMFWFDGVIRSHAQAPGPARISMKDFMFSPVPLTVSAGSTVTWTNLDDEPHTAVSDTGLFRSGAMDTNETFSFKFDTPGTYHFTCSIHPRMVGTIIVR
ncbi:MAG TPA: cupredoxin domain-containing protein [Steroidobacteraceae bacterium]|jgi:plastocyanin|nr:cupredoxin domain-containing protein [Steroidobacteraceae bacterium]